MSKYIVYGGSFNPLHLGHVNVIKELLVQFEGYNLIILPSFHSPLKKLNYDPGINYRISFLNKYFEGNKRVLVDDFEMKSKKMCYTVDVLPELVEKYDIKQLKFVIGQDQFLQFHQWKNYKDILKMTDLIVVSRPGYAIDFSEDLDGDLINEFEEENTDEIILNSGKKIHLMNLNKNYNISSSNIRSQLIKGVDMSSSLPEGSVQYFNENKLYSPIQTKVSSFEEFTKDCFSILKEKNALGILAYDVRNITQPSEFNLIASGTNTRQTKALADHLIRAIRKKYALSPIGVEGVSEGRWVVIDYGSLIVHIFYDFIRSEYNIEELWSKGILLESEE